jgi:hypothetical protein
MAHWAELDENNVVLRVTVGSNDDSDEGYQWLIDNLGGRWLKCSYNTKYGVHAEGGTPFRWTYPSAGYEYFEDIDSFVEPRPYNSWVLNKETKKWQAPIPKPDTGFWAWDEENKNWKEGYADSEGKIITM